MFSMVKPWTAPIDVEEQEKKGYIGVPINFFGLYKYRTNTRSSWIKKTISKYGQNTTLPAFCSLTVLFCKYGNGWNKYRNMCCHVYIFIC